MKVLTLTQPWASLVIHGLKQIETRSWNTNYRGWIGIHAAKGFPNWAREVCATTPFLDALEVMGLTVGTLPLGCVLGEAHLKSTYRITGPPDEKREGYFGDYTPGRYGWLLDRAFALPEAVPARGALGLWEWTYP